MQTEKDYRMKIIIYSPNSKNSSAWFDSIAHNVENHIVDLLRLNTLFRDLTDESDFSNTLKRKP